MAHNTEEIAGVDLPDSDAAREQADKFAREEMIDGVVDGINRTGWETIVRDEGGREIYHLRFSDLIPRQE